MEENRDINMDETTVIEFDIQSSPNSNNMIINNESTIAPVIIEELDENVLNSMDVDMTEFVEANALEVEELPENSVENYAFSDQQDAAAEIATDLDDEDVLLTPDEEERLTKQFLNGELTFSEYSMRMDRGIDQDIDIDQDVDLETTEIDSTRKECQREKADADKAKEESIPKSPSRQHSRRKRKRRNLPPALQGLMGEANLRFARGEIELAVQMCMEIIRQVPSAPEPFQTLAMIYETDQPDKSLQFALIAAHLDPKDADQWVRLANLSLESGDIKQAITCYSRAIQASPKDISLYETRAQLHQQNGDKRAYLRGYAKLIHQLGSEDGVHVIKYAKMLAKKYMQDDNNKQALEAMENIFTKCPDCVTLEEVNVMTEILISLKQFERCLNILTEYTNIHIQYKTTDDAESSQSKKRKNESTSNEHNELEIEACDMPDDVVVDLKAKFLVCLIELDQLKIAKQFLPKFYLNENPELSGDLFLDVAEAWMGKKEFRLALDLLDPLVNSQNFSLAAVWLRHAECWVGCKDLKKAIKSYEVVRKLSPQHLGAKAALAKLYQLKAQYNKAIDVLVQNIESDTIDPDILYQRSILLYKVKRYEEYFDSGILLLSRHWITLRSKVEVNTLTRTNAVRQRLEALKLHRLSRGEKFEEENAPSFLTNEDLSEKSEFLLFLQMCRLAYNLKKYGRLQRLCFSALTSKRFEQWNSKLLFLCLISCIYNNDTYHGFNIVRQLVRDSQTSNYWNLLNIIIQRAEDSRHNRFIMRLLGREDVFSYLHVMHANNCLVSGTYKYALNDYISLFKVAPSALLALLVSVTLLQMACQKLSAKKNQLVIQALAFFKKYMQLRGKDAQHEAYYNMARAFHQIGLLPAAVHYYKLVLDTEQTELVQQNSHLLDLRREAAFNLHLIYLQSENLQLARMYLENYITV